MRGRSVALFLLLLVSNGCYALADMEASRAAKPQSVARPAEGRGAARPAEGPASTKRESSAVKPEDDEQTTSLRARAAAAEKMALEAVRREGSEEARNTANGLATECAKSTSKRRECIDYAKKVEGGSGKHVGVMAGLAILLARDVRPSLKGPQVAALEPNVRSAEEFAKIAHDEAEDVVDGRRKLDAERGAIDGARTECSANPAACKSKCDGGDPNMCVVRAEELRKASKLPEAKLAATRACEKHLHTACILAGEIDDDIKAAGAKNDALWFDVQEVGDDLARKQHQTEMVAKLANRPHLQLQAQRMRTINAAIVTEKYCPAKKAFVAAAGSAEFGKRAATHCQGDPPEASGLSGAQVTLTTQCQAAYASACP